MSAFTTAAVLALAAQWAQPVAPKTITAEALVESGLDPLAIHDNTTGRTYHPDTITGAIEIASRLEAAGSNYDAGLMQINRSNFNWLHLTLAGAFDPRRSIEAAAAVMVSMSRYNTGGLEGLRNGYVDRVLATNRQLDERPSLHISHALPSAAASMASPSAIPPAPPPAVLDMLHATITPPPTPGQVVNLLGGLVPSHAVETAER